MLSHVVLYAKGWYLNTGDVFADLKKILVLDNYTPFTNTDVYSIILNSVQNSKLYRWTDLTEVLNGIHPNNCWKYGYYVKANAFWSSGTTAAELPDYDMPTAFIYYVLSNLRFLDSEYWNPVTPKLTKYPKGEDVTIRQIYANFVKTKVKNNE